MTTTLLEIADDFRAMADLMDGLDGGELDEAAERALSEWFADLGDKQAHKLDSYCALIRTFELRASVRRSEMERLSLLVKAEENKAKRLKDRLKLYLEATGQRKVDTDRYSVSVQANGGSLPVEVSVPVDELPIACTQAKLFADVDMIRETLLAGGDVHGCKLLPRGSHVRIR